MIFQSITDLETIIGVGLAFALAFLFNHLTFNSLHGFLCFLLFFNSFMVWGNLIPTWIMILNLISVLVSTIVKTKQRIGVI